MLFLDLSSEPYDFCMLPVYPSWKKEKILVRDMIILKKFPFSFPDPMSSPEKKPYSYPYYDKYKILLLIFK